MFTGTQTIRAGSKGLPPRDFTDAELKKGSSPNIPYILGLSECIQRVCRDFDIHKQHLSQGKTLRSHLAKVKDIISTESSVLYSLPCSCGKVYLSEITRRWEQRLKEHQDACKRGDEKVSAIAKQAWQQ